MLLGGETTKHKQYPIYIYLTLVVFVMSVCEIICSCTPGEKCNNYMVISFEGKQALLFKPGMYTHKSAI